MEQASEIARDFRLVDVEIHGMNDLFGVALSIALETGRSAYDSMYLALADRLGARVVTADRKLFNALQDGPHATLIAWVEDEP